LSDAPAAGGKWNADCTTRAVNHPLRTLGSPAARFGATEKPHADRAPSGAGTDRSHDRKELCKIDKIAGLTDESVSPALALIG